MVEWCLYHPFIHSFMIIVGRQVVSQQICKSLQLFLISGVVHFELGKPLIRSFMHDVCLPGETYVLRSHVIQPLWVHWNALHPRIGRISARECSEWSDMCDESSSDATASSRDLGGSNWTANWFHVVETNRSIYPFDGQHCSPIPGKIITTNRPRPVYNYWIAGRAFYFFEAKKFSCARVSRNKIGRNKPCFRSTRSEWWKNSGSSLLYPCKLVISGIIKAGYVLNGETYTI